MGVLEYVEDCLSWQSYNVRGHDESLFVKGPAFTNFPSPTIELTSPDCGPSNAVFKRDYTQLGIERFPKLEWTDPSPETKEYLLVSEDADLPMPSPVFSRLFHGMYYSIPPRTNRVRASDFELAEDGMESKTLKGGFKFIPTLYKNAYVGPKPLLGHGSHRYFYQLIALKEPLDLAALGAEPTKAQIAAAISGKVLGWGVWVGSYERPWVSRGV